VVVVRDGVLPLGSAETVDEASGRVLLVGSGTRAAADLLKGVAAEVRCVEAGPFAPAAFAAALAPVLADEPVVVLPASADGRDLAPRLALELARPLAAPCVAVTVDGATVVRGGGLVLEALAFEGPAVATLQPGSRGTEAPERPAAEAVELAVVLDERGDARSLELRQADAATVDLAEARRIVAGGAGLGSPEAMARLQAVATALGCATGATRVVADAGWVPFSRQIGTTGVVVEPDLYVAVGISGAVQHVSGIGQPKDVVAVNTDPSCPMMALADLALVADGSAMVDVLARRLQVAEEGLGRGEDEEGSGGA